MITIKMRNSGTIKVLPNNEAFALIDSNQADRFTPPTEKKNPAQGYVAPTMKPKTEAMQPSRPTQPSQPQSPQKPQE